MGRAMGLNRTEAGNRYPVYFFAVYFLLYAGNGIFGPFIPVYLSGIGFGEKAIGSLMAIGPFVAMAAQPLWGYVGDRRKYKNTVLQGLILATALVMLAFPLFHSYIYVFAVMAFFTFFQTAIYPLNDAITLESIEPRGWKFGPIRMAGTLGYAVMAVMAGLLVKDNTSRMFPVYFILFLITFGVVFMLPRVKGHQWKVNCNASFPFVNQESRFENEFPNLHAKVPI